jgi:hypothetical protein
LVDDSRIQTAARLGELFGTDPLILLDVDDLDWLIRIACAKVIEQDRIEQQKNAQKNKGNSFDL